MTQPRLGTSPFVTELVNISLSVLHHDGDDSELDVHYERKVLEIEFSKAIRKKLTKDEVLLQFADWVAVKQAELHACTTGDCPHWSQGDCSRSLVDEFKESEVQ